jgi:succinoglycan biosynthesis protein ExoM
MTNNGQLGVVVAVLTYRRQADLADLLPLLVAEASAVHDVVTVLVVDNDPDAGAAGLVDQLRGPGVRYVHESERGIAAARNRALDEAGGADLLVFIDDDERPVPGWLGHLLHTFAAHPGVAGVVGPVVSEFRGEPDPWVAAGGFFQRRRLPTGSPVDVAATNNLLVDMTVVRRLGLRFDHRYGLTGGSDTLFTRQLVRGGERLVWCDEALVLDQVPAERLTRRWVTRRAVRSGNCWSRVDLEVSATRRERARSRITQAARGLARLGAGTSLAAAGLATGSLPRQAAGTRTAARGWGLVTGALGVVVSEYHRPRAVSSASPPRLPTGESGARQSRLGIVVVNYGSHRLLEANLPHLDLPSVPAEVVVVDNHHSEQERRAVEAAARRHGWTLVPRERNEGFPAGVNAGAAVALQRGATAVLLLNPDVAVDTATLRALLEHTVQETDSLVTPQILRPDGRAWFRGSRLLLDTGDLSAAAERWGGRATVPWLTAACLAVPRPLWESLGGMDPEYFLYWEDVDLSYRCLRAGGRLVVRDDLTVVHDVGGTQATGSVAAGGAGSRKSDLYYYFNIRNRLLFASKHLSRRQALRWVYHSPAASWRILLRGGRRQLVQSPGPGRAAARGVLAGSARVLRAAARRRTPGPSPVPADRAPA